MEDMLKYGSPVRAQESESTIPCPERILHNNQATIVFWEDGSKTVVKRAENDQDNEYNAFCAALAIKIYGNNSRVNKNIKKAAAQKSAKRQLKAKRGTAHEQEGKRVVWRRTKSLQPIGEGLIDEITREERWKEAIDALTNLRSWLHHKRVLCYSSIGPSERDRNELDRSVKQACIVLEYLREEYTKKNEDGGMHGWDE